MDFVHWLELATGFVLVGVSLYDLFKSVVLPRPAINKFVLVRRTFFALWRLWRSVGDRITNPARKEGWLATFGPIGVLIMFGIWAVAFVIGYALMIDGVHDEMHPVPGDL